MYKVNVDVLDYDNPDKVRNKTIELGTVDLFKFSELYNTNFNKGGREVTNCMQIKLFRKNNPSDEYETFHVSLKTGYDLLCISKYLDINYYYTDLEAGFIDLDTDEVDKHLRVIERVSPEIGIVVNSIKYENITHLSCLFTHDRPDRGYLSIKEGDIYRTFNIDKKMWFMVENQIKNVSKNKWDLRYNIDRET